MRKIILIVVVLLLVLALLSGGAFLWWRNQMDVPAIVTDTPPVAFVVPPGQSNSVTIDQLYAKGLIRSKVAAKIYLRLNRLDQKILPGDYVINAYTTLPGVFETLSAGPKDVWVTLPEGWRREQIAARLHSTVTSIDPDEFIDQTVSLEGLLFPDTYLIPAQAAASDVVNILTNNFSKKTQLNTADTYNVALDGKTATLSGQEILIVASLVEREAKDNDDRPLIAGILLRRYFADWPLQVDATLQYALGTQRCRATPQNCVWWQPPMDTRVPSSYNTYTNKGLPPGPICNPGAAALNAVRHPQSSPYWYYLTGTDGVMRYSTTLQEHNSNIDKYLKS